MKEKKMKKIIIFGLSDLGRLLLWYLKKDTNREVVAFTAHREYIDCDKFCGLPVEDFETIESKYSVKNYEILIAIGNRKMNNIRKNIFINSKNKGYSIASYIHSTVSLNSANVGEGNIILENCLLYPYSQIGDGNLLWDNVVINHDCKCGNFNTFAGSTDLNGYVKIGDNCFFGKKSIIKEHIRIADYSLIGAGAFCQVNTSKYDVIVPNLSYKLKNKKSKDLM